MKKALLPSLFLLLLGPWLGAQTIIFANADAYLETGGLMPGGGLGMETAFASFFSRAENEVTCLAFDVEFLAPPETSTQRDGSGLAVPFIVKERFIVNRGFAWTFGPGLALILISQDVYDAQWDEWYFSSTIGGALFVEAGLEFMPRPPFVLSANLRAGALLSDDGTYPFFGLSAMFGIYIQSDDDY